MAMAIVNSAVATGRPINGADGFTFYSQSWRRGRLLLPSGPCFSKSGPNSRLTGYPEPRGGSVADCLDFIPRCRMSGKDRTSPIRGEGGKIRNPRIAAIIEDEVPCRGGEVSLPGHRWEFINMGMAQLSQ